jgi:hypothetical protein
LAVVGAASAAGGFPVVRDGKAQCQIVVGHGAQPVEKQAADDLARCLQVMTGVAVPLVEEGQEQPVVPRILVGPCKLPEAIMAKVKARDYGGYIITRSGPDLVVRGPSEYGSNNAIRGLTTDYLGVRWFGPGPLGEYIPRCKDIVLPTLDVAVNPGFRFRFFSGVEEDRPWDFRNRLDIPGNWNAPFLGSMGHYLWAIIRPSKYGKDHPEYFPLLGGQRYLGTDGDQRANPCTSNPGAIQATIDTINQYFDEHPSAHTHSVCINDTNTWCECAACQAQDVDVPAFRGRKIYSDRYYTFVNAVARGVAAKHPDKFIGCFAYAGVEPVPAEIKHLEPNVYVGITQDCSQHYDRGYRQKDYDFLKAWQRVSSHVGKYDYYGLGAIAPRYYPHLIAQDIKHSAAIGLEGFHSEAYPQWAVFGPQIYLAARLLWDPSLDPDALLAEYFDKLYGPAGKEMAAFYQVFEDAWMRTKRPGTWFEGIGSVAQELAMYRPADLAAARQHLRQAQALPDTDLLRQRVAYVERGTAYALNLIEGWLAAKELEGLQLSPATAPQVLKAVQTLNQCVRREPDLYQQSLTGDPYTGGRGWYEAGGRGLNTQWKSRCEQAAVTALQGLTGAYQAAGNAGKGEEVWREFERTVKGTDMELIVRVLRGELDGLPNLLPNPSFENGQGERPVGPDWVSEGLPPGWSSWQIDPGKGRLYLDGSRVHGGKVAAVLQGGDTTCYITTFPVQPGKRYVAWVYTWAIRIGGPHTSALDLRWQDKDGHWSNQDRNHRTLARQAGRWERLVTAATAPEGAARAVILLSAEGLEDVDKVWFDDVFLGEVPG